MLQPEPRQVKTVGELRDALASVPDSTPLKAVFEGRCVVSTELALLGIINGQFMIDADGDMTPYARTSRSMLG